MKYIFNKSYSGKLARERLFDSLLNVASIIGQVIIATVAVAMFWVLLVIISII